MSLQLFDHPLRNFELSSSSDHSLCLRISSENENFDRTLWISWTTQILINSKLPILNVHPSYDEILISYSPEQINETDLLSLVQGVLSKPRKVPDLESDSPILDVPVQYGGEQGPDLDSLAEFLGLSSSALIELHSAPTYRVSFLGFSPGFPYLSGLASALHSPRRSSPRLKVSGGSVGIAGGQTGIYPNDSPAGWQIIGRTHLNLFNPRRSPPSLLETGQRLRFIPESRSLSFEGFKPVERENAETANPQTLLEVLQPGFASSIQDEGRYHQAHLGVSAGGAADPFAYAEGQRLLQNPSGTSAIEMTVSGGSFRFLKQAAFCVTGGDCDPRLSGFPISMWTTYFAKPGDVLQCGHIQNSARSYLNVRGGFGSEILLGSESTLLSAGWGGHCGRLLKAGDSLGKTHHDCHVSFARSPLRIRESYRQPVSEIELNAGPQWHWFEKSAQMALLSTEFEVSQECNRSGLRLLGPNLGRSEKYKNIELLTEGTANGSLQVTPAGQVLILFCEQQTTGGYPKIAVVKFHELFKLGRLVPGQKFRFRL